MNPIDGTRRALETLRQQITAKSGHSSTAPPANRTGTAPSQTSASLERSVRLNAQRRLRALSRDDPQFNRQAVRVIVASVLEAELGDALVNTSEYQEMLTVVSQQIGNDAGLSGSFRTLVEQWLDKP